MPSTSKAQHRFMEAMLHGAKPKSGKKGPSKKVAKEFTSADKGKVKNLPEKKKKSGY